jgi:hypothetical protein
MPYNTIPLQRAMHRRKREDITSLYPQEILLLKAAHAVGLDVIDREFEMNESRQAPVWYDLLCRFPWGGVYVVDLYQSSPTSKRKKKFADQFGIPLCRVKKKDLTGMRVELELFLMRQQREYNMTLAQRQADALQLADYIPNQHRIFFHTFTKKEPEDRDPHKEAIRQAIEARREAIARGEEVY